MKKILSIIILILSCTYACFARTTSEDRVYISVIIPDNEEIPEEAARQLDQKLTQLLTDNGMASTDTGNRFAITPRVSVISKGIVPGPPSKVSMKLDLTFIIGDAEENKVFESVTVSTTGVGVNENKAFISAIKAIKPKMPELVSLLNNAKGKIIQYYRAKCDKIISDAAVEASRRNYEEAIYMLSQVPDLCDCAYECQSLMIEYNTALTNNTATELLNEAKARWAASPNSDGASAVADIITRIPANTPSQADIDDLVDEINTKIRNDEHKEWEFKMKQYNDSIAKQKRYEKAQLEQQRADNAMRRQSIESARQIGLAYAQNRPKTIIYKKNVLLWAR